MKEGKHKLKQFKNISFTILGLIIIIAIGINVSNLSSGNIVGKVAYNPILVQGSVAPDLPDGTTISFKISELEIASTNLLNNQYGYDPEINLKLDDPKTSEKEGYSKGDIVTVYIMDVEAYEFSYIDSNLIQKDIEMSPKNRAEIATKAVQYTQNECISKWDCTEWSECESGIQRRECLDSARCIQKTEKPDETLKCEEVEAVVAQPSEIKEVKSEKEVSATAFVVTLISLLVIGIIIASLAVKKKNKL